MSVTLRLLALGSLLLLAVCVETVPAQSDWPWAISELDANNTYQIFLRTRDGSQRQQLTNSPSGAWMPAWAPDGQRLAYTVGTAGAMGIHVLDMMTGVDTTLTTATERALAPTWDPTGNWLAFAHSDTLSGTNQIWVMLAADGTQRRQLTFTVGDSNTPSWAPDDSWIVFMTSDGSGGFHLEVVRPDGSQRQAITPNTWDSYVGAWIEQKVPAWSPDGQFIAYWNGLEASLLTCPDCAPLSPHDQYIMDSWHLWLKNMVTGAMTELAPGDDPAWTADSTIILHPGHDGSSLGVEGFFLTGQRALFFATNGVPMHTIAQRR